MILEDTSDAIHPPIPPNVDPMRTCCQVWQPKTTLEIATKVDTTPTRISVPHQALPTGWGDLVMIPNKKENIVNMCTE